MNPPDVKDSSGGTFFANQTGGTTSQDELIFARDALVTRKFQRAAAGELAWSASLSGEAFPRWEMFLNGLRAGDGSATTDIGFSRGTAAGVAAWSMMAPLIMAGGNINLSFQSGTPAGWPAFTDGSCAIRTDGAAGTFFYGRIADAWVALA